MRTESLATVLAAGGEMGDVGREFVRPARSDVGVGAYKSTAPVDMVSPAAPELLGRDRCSVQREPGTFVGAGEEDRRSAVRQGRVAGVNGKEGTERRRIRQRIDQP